ncbi:MAG: MBOAT family protein [Bacteroidia bacterium]|nr:MBOAT family protein [Bacteroidia bacterium]
MIFNSIEFLIFLPIVFLLYWFVFDKNRKAQNILIVVASYVFYGWWDWRFLSLIVISTLVDYFIGLSLANQDQQKKRKRLLSLSLAVNLGLLGFFKYFNFFVDSFTKAFTFAGVPIDSPTLKIVLPVGISFYTFQTLSYTIDVYKRRQVPTNDFISFAAFVCFFPQLVAGPIERAQNLIHQFTAERRFKYVDMQFGFIRVLWGMFKKVVIADRLAVQVDTVFNNPELFHGQHYIVASVLFAFQIYCDFSGYSDIAIGTSRMLGFRLMENFRSPYFAVSLKDFWRRWHISLSTWFKDYVYIPLGGSRGTAFIVIRNLLITFLVSGLWHGASWTFVIWGGIHGLFLVIENYTGIGNKSNSTNWRTILGMTRTFIIVCVAWIFFRANTVGDAFYIVGHLFDVQPSLGVVSSSGTLYFGEPLWRFGAGVLSIGILVLIEYFIGKGLLTERFIVRKPLLVRWAIYLTLIFSILVFGRFEVNQFIYFQF